MRSEAEELLRSVEHDFSYFSAVVESPSLFLTYENNPPDYDGMPELTCSFVTPRNICFSDGQLTYIDYFGRALNIYDRAANRCRIISEDVELAHEIAYLTILSRVSEQLERIHLHRIHGLGIESAGKGTIILLPSGGGKSTMALALLRELNSFRLISEDSPLLNRRGQMLPFPLRIGVHPDNVPADIDPAFTRLDKRIEFSPKVNIDIRYFRDQVSRNPVPVSSILIGVRTTGRGASITPSSRSSLLRHLLMNSVIGIGLYQGLEFLFQKSIGESARHLGLILSRAYSNLVLLGRVRIYRFLVGRDTRRNYECLREFLLRADALDEHSTE